MFEWLNSKKQWDVWMGYAIAYFSKTWSTVCIPLTDSQDYDLIVDIKWILNRVQVKTASHLSYWKYVVYLRTSWWNRSWTWKKKFLKNNNVESLFVLCDNWEQYLIPVNILPKNSLMLNKDKIQYKL